tara:strand:- start:1249 stop:1395 length:147 start_codon:yes stop_codon:yes gene_type:complete
MGAMDQRGGGSPPSFWIGRGSVAVLFFVGMGAGRGGGGGTGRLVPGLL